MLKNTDKTDPNPTIDKHIGSRIRYLREHRAITIKAFVKKIGISSTQLSNYEHGNTVIRMDILYIIAQALDAPLEWFFKGYNDITTPSTSNTPSPQELGEFLELLEQTSGRGHKPSILSLLTDAVNNNENPNHNA